MGQRAIAKNTLFYGDNLDIIRQYLADESIDLIYLDPPFNSNRNYNVLYKEESGTESTSQIKAFEDTWHWNYETEDQYRALAARGAKLGTLLEALVGTMGRNQMTAYLIMMAIRLVELHRVLKPTGSLYLHCDPTASHYLKMILDMIFGAGNFQNQITWKRSSPHNDSTSRFGRISDVILFYTKTPGNKFNRFFMPYSQSYLSAEWTKLPSGKHYKAENMLDPQKKMKEYDFMGTTARWRTNYDKMLELWNAPQTEVPQSHGRIKLGRNGKPIKRCRIVFLDESQGVSLQDFWDDVKYIAGGSSEGLGYPTQKPLALLERIIQASSNPGDVVLDPFCGCGTAIHAAQKLGRIWVGIDITPLATTLIKSRLYSAFKVEAKKDYDLLGEPTTLADAHHLAQQDRYQFQWWALGLLPAFPYGGQGDSKQGKKGSDKGIDGIMTFRDSGEDHEKRIIVQVKSGKVSSRDIRDLNGTVDREKNAVIGVFITLEPPSRNMVLETLELGRYKSVVFKREYPKIQILTLEELLNGAKVAFPGTDTTLKQAQREEPNLGEQKSLL